MTYVLIARNFEDIYTERPTHGDRETQLGSITGL